MLCRRSTSVGWTGDDRCLTNSKSSLQPCEHVLALVSYRLLNDRWNATLAIQSQANPVSIPARVILDDTLSQRYPPLFSACLAVLFPCQIMAATQATTAVASTFVTSVGGMALLACAVSSGAFSPLLMTRSLPVTPLPFAVGAALP